MENTDEDDWTFDEIPQKTYVVTWINPNTQYKRNITLQAYNVDQAEAMSFHMLGVNKERYAVFETRVVNTPQSISQRQRKEQ